MYLSQAFLSQKKWVYSLVGILVLLLLFQGVLDSSGAEKQLAQLKEMTHKIGELPTYAYMLFSFAFFLAPLFVVVKLVHNQSITKFTTSREKIDFRRILFSFLVFGGIVVFATVVEYLLNPEDFLWNFQPDRFLILLIISVLLLPVQIGFEEYFFRGYFMQWLGILSRNRWVPLVLSSVLFGLAHGSNPEVLKMGYGMMFFYIGMGFLLGIVTMMDDGMELALGIHFSNNLFTVLLVTSDWSVFQTPSLLKQVVEPSIDFVQVFSMFLVYSVVIFIFAKKYNWTSWGEKLFGRLPI